MMVFVSPPPGHLPPFGLGQLGVMPGSPNPHQRILLAIALF